MPRIRLDVAALLAILGVLAWNWVPERTVSAQVVQRLRTVTDISGTGSNVTLGTGTCQWIQVYAPLANASGVRLGDTNISTTRGSLIEKGYGEFLPFLPGSKVYDMAQTYVLVQSGDKATVLCGF